jgi:hypothetical protein
MHLSRTLWIVAALGATCALAAGAHATAPTTELPNLRPVEVGHGFSAYAGTNAWATVLNDGTRRAARSTLLFCASRDRRRSRDDRRIRGSIVVGSLAAGRRSASWAVVIDGLVRRGEYVVACADATHRVAESDERDNCAASETPVGPRDSWLSYPSASSASTRRATAKAALAAGTPA